MISEIKDAFVSGKKEVVLKYKDKDITFYVNEIGFLAAQGIGIQAGRRGQNVPAMLVAESVTDKDGNKFTYEEVMRLKKEFAEPLFAAVVDLHKLETEEKN